jgi:hypothetical protein
MIKLILRDAINWFSRLFKSKETYKAMYVDDMPKNLSPNTVYVLGNTNHKYLASMLCPCGCMESLNMNLTATAKPRWSLSIAKDNTASFHPSLWKKTGCKSHFFLNSGKVNWV